MCNGFLVHGKKKFFFLEFFFFFWFFIFGLLYVACFWFFSHLGVEEVCEVLVLDVCYVFWGG